MPKQYDAIKASELKSGKSLKDAKRIAAATYEKYKKPGQEDIQTIAARERRKK